MPAFLLTLLLAVRLAFAITVDEILVQIDKNLTYEARDSSLTMTVTKGSRVKTYKMHSYGRGQDEMAMEYLEPARDKGTKMLKKVDELWMYLPAIEKVQKISGHLLRDDLMGSDMSYEDLMESSRWQKAYTGQVIAEEAIEGRMTWKIEMKAKDTTVAYPRRVIWVDQKSFVPVRQELYALQGMLLKTWLMQDIRSIEGREFPMKMVVEDQVQKGSRTEIVFDKVSFAVKLPEEVFSTRWLER
jgi:outer membrane lipoprotein-sorting protein